MVYKSTKIHSESSKNNTYLLKKQLLSDIFFSTIILLVVVNRFQMMCFYSFTTKLQKYVISLII